MIALLRWSPLLLGLLLWRGAQAQNVDTDATPYERITTYGVTTNTNSGILGGFVFRQERLLNSELFGKSQYQYLAIELVNVKHPREVQTSLGQQFTQRFIGGKENFLFVLRPQYGRSVALFRRGADEGISVNAIVAAGPSLGIIKPYYVQVEEGNRLISVPYSSTVNGAYVGSQILGSGGFFQGLGESKFTVGVHLKTAFSFELSTFRSNTTGIEVGFLTELFPQKIIIIPTAENRYFFTSGYLTLYFGSKR